MKEIEGDIWQVKASKVITTNLRGVMGRGLAFQAKERFGSLEREYKDFLSSRNKDSKFLFVKKIKRKRYTYRLILLPVKYHWRQVADIDLIKKSLVELSEIFKESDEKCVIPPIGTGFGGLDWNHVVKPIVEDILGDNNNFFIIYPTGIVYNKYRRSFRKSSSKEIRDAMENKI